MDIIRVPEQIGTVLRAARLQQGMTQAEVAAKLGISVQAMSRLPATLARVRELRTGSGSPTERRGGFASCRPAGVVSHGSANQSA